MEEIEIMNKLGKAAAEAGESLRKFFLATKKLRKLEPRHKQWQPPYKYHR